jgi:hypothetical protein
MRHSCERVVRLLARLETFGVFYYGVRLRTMMQNDPQRSENK